MALRTPHHASRDTGHNTGHDDFGGLARDLPLLNRRHALRLFAGFGAVALAGCSSSSESASDSTAAIATADTTGGTTADTTDTTGASDTTAVAGSDAAAGSSATSECTIIPAETAGPYPGDGSNGPDVLSEPDVVRKDIRTSIGSASGTAPGTELTIAMKIVDSAKGCAPIANAAVYVWHCDGAGNYSMYSDAAADENFCRGVQVTDAKGDLSFTTVFPGCYPGRWPHVHFEVYASVDDAKAASNILATSQIALPKDICDTVYATAGYEASPGNLSQLSLLSDMVFGDDGGARQLATMTGSVGKALTATLVVPV